MKLRGHHIAIGLGAAALIVAALSGDRSVMANGLRLRGDDLDLVSWDAWMGFAPDAIRESVHGGAINPEQIVADLMRQTFPGRAWPPLVESPAADAFDRMVAAVDPFVSKPADASTGLRIVPDAGA